MSNSTAFSPERTSWVLMGLALAFGLGFHLVPGLLAGLLLFSLLHKLDRQLQHWRWASKGSARLWALAILGTVALLLAAGVLLGLSLLWRARVTALPELFARMAQILDSTRTWLGGQWIPEELADEDTLRETLTSFLRGHAAELKTAGSHAGKILAHILAGLAIGGLAAFHHADPEGPKPLAAALGARLTHFLAAFEAVVYAQVRISLINTALSALFLFGVLPLFGVHLPLRFTLVGVTFVAGLLPVIGNVLSNTAIVLISLEAGPGAALASLIYLVLVHKLEYFVNAKIVGGRIHAQIWEVILAMVLMEVAFGAPGLVFAPILYAYLKGELREQKWV